MGIKPQVFFDGSGNGTLQIQDVNYAFTYPTGEWINVKQRIDLDRDQTTLYINNSPVKTWSFSATGQRKLSALNFYPINSSYRFFVDDIHLRRVYNKTKESLDITVFPNPASELLNISFANSDKTIATVSILNTIGQEIYRQQVMDNNNLQIDISSLSPGAYFVNIVSTAEDSWTEKVIIK